MSSHCHARHMLRLLSPLALMGMACMRPAQQHAPSAMLLPRRHPQLSNTIALCRTPQVLMEVEASTAWHAAPTNQVCAADQACSAAPPPCWCGGGKRGHITAGDANAALGQPRWHAAQCLEGRRVHLWCICVSKGCTL